MLSRLQTNIYQAIQPATTFELSRSIVTMSLHFAGLSLQMRGYLYVRAPALHQKTLTAKIAIGV